MADLMIYVNQIRGLYGNGINSRTSHDRRYRYGFHTENRYRTGAKVTLINIGNNQK